MPGRHLAEAGTPQAPVFTLGKPFQLKRRDGRSELWLPWAVFPCCGAFQVAGALLQGSIKPRRHPNYRKGTSFFPFSCQIKHNPHTPFSCGVHEAEGSVESCLTEQKEGKPFPEVSSDLHQQAGEGELHPAANCLGERRGE